MIIDDEQRRLHVRRSRRIAWVALSAIVLCVVAGPFLAGRIESAHFLRFPLSFFLVAHGIVIGIIAAMSWFIVHQEAADREYNVVTHA
jgi:putative solute:sodium symporter small subunit